MNLKSREKKSIAEIVNDINFKLKNVHKHIHEFYFCIQYTTTYAYTLMCQMIMLSQTPGVNYFDGKLRLVLCHVCSCLVLVQPTFVQWIVSIEMLF